MKFIKTKTMKVHQGFNLELETVETLKAIKEQAEIPMGRIIDELVKEYKEKEMAAK